MDVFLVVLVLTVPLGVLVTPETPVVVIFAPFVIFSGALEGRSAGQIFGKEEKVGFPDGVVANLILGGVKMSLASSLFVTTLVGAEDRG